MGAGAPAVPRRPVLTGGGRTMGTFFPFRVIWVLLPIMVDGVIEETSLCSR